MQHIDNDMDDLFQRAAENYSLNSGNGDWESIAKRIAPPVKDDAVAGPLKNKGRKKIILLSLLLLSLMAGGLVFQRNASNLYQRGKASNLIQGADKKLPGAIIKNNTAPDEQAAEQIINPTKTQGKNVQFKKDGQAITVNSWGHITTAISNPLIGSAGENKSTNEPITKESESSSDNNFPRDNLKENQLSQPSEIAKGSDELLSAKVKSADKEINGDAKKQLPSPIEKNTQQNAKNFQQKNKRIYVGLVAGIDYSKAQSMGYNKNGFTAGVLAGLQLTNKLSVETGISFNKKTYSSEGWEFNMAKVASTMPAGMVINNLQSKSTVIEIPVRLRYDFIRKKNQAFFVGAGVSAYIITKENNHYNVTMNGSQDKTTGLYQSNNYRLPAVANISIGYQQTVSKTLSLRIEPFIKIPLQGMGVGSVHVTSAGLQVGIARQLH